MVKNISIAIVTALLAFLAVTTVAFAQSASPSASPSATPSTTPSMSASPTATPGTGGTTIPSGAPSTGRG